jgi:hypothetical protein
VGSKYRPSIKDIKATQRIHQNANREGVNADAKKSQYMPALPPKPAPGKSDVPAQSLGVSEAPRKN